MGTVLQWDRSYRGSKYLEWLCVNRMDGDLRSCTGMRGFLVRERIAKRFSQSSFDRRVAIRRNRVSQVKLEQPQIIKAHHVIGMFVCVDDCVNDADLFPE